MRHIRCANRALVRKPQIPRIALGLACDADFVDGPRTIPYTRWASMTERRARKWKGRCVMLGIRSSSRLVRAAVAVAVVGGSVAATTLSAAAATGPFTCSTPISQECEITAVGASVAGLNTETVTYTCTVVSVAVVLETGTSCYLAPFGSTTPVTAVTAPVSITSPVFVPGQVITLGNSQIVPAGQYWVCMVPAYVTLSLGGPVTVLGQHDCSAGPV